MELLSHERELLAYYIRQSRGEKGRAFWRMQSKALPSVVP